MTSEQPQLSRPGVGTDGQEAILEAAALAFTRSGYAATSIDDIADLLGATKGRVYHYYRSKADIFLDVITAGMNQLLEAIEPIARDDHLGPAQRIREMARIHAVLMMTRHSYQHVAVQGVEMHLVGSLGPRQQQTLRDVIGLRDRYEQLFADVIEAGRESGEFRDTPARLATKPLLGALNWITMWYRPGEEQGEERERTIERIAEECADFAVGGVRRRSP